MLWSGRYADLDPAHDSEQTAALRSPSWSRSCGVIPGEAVGTFEAAVCPEHQQAIYGGAQWTYDTVDRAIYMGQDVAAAGHQLVRSIRLSHLETLMPDLGDVPIIAHFACQTRGSQERQAVSLVFTQEMAVACIDALVRLIPPHRLAELLQSRSET